MDASKIFTLKQNAVRAGKKALANGTAPAPTYEIKPAAGGGFRIVWDTVESRPEAGIPLPSDDDVHKFRSNAKAAAERAIAKGEAPAKHYLIDKTDGGYRVLWRDEAPDPKAGTALSTVSKLLQRPEGATIAEIQAATGWKPHTARAFISTKFRGQISTEKLDGRGRVYRAAA